LIHISIIGTGLIGTSLGMALRNAELQDAPLGPTTIVGYDQDSRASAEARSRLAIDRQARTLDEALAEAHVVVVAVPPQAIRAVFGEIGHRARAGTVITDVASTKAQVLAWARELLPTTVDFIGGHPMAGKERSGPGHADPELLRGSIYCLTPTPQVRQPALDTIDALVRQAGAKPYYIDAVEHDHYVAAVSHLPFLLSAILVETTSRSPGWKEMAPLAATGFRDLSRLASGDAEMHRDICMTNREAIARWVNETIRSLQEVRTQLEAGDSDGLLELFAHARAVRKEWLASRPNLRPGEADYENLTNMTVERPNLFGRMFGGRPPREPKK
jgi:prephenate dehydrogenase